MAQETDSHREATRQELLNNWAPKLLGDRSFYWKRFIKDDDLELNTDTWIDYLKGKKVIEREDLKSRAILRVWSFRFVRNPGKILNIYKRLPIRFRFSFIFDLSFVDIAYYADARYSQIGRSLVEDIVRTKPFWGPAKDESAMLDFEHNMEHAVWFLSLCKNKSDANWLGNVIEENIAQPGIRKDLFYSLFQDFGNSSKSVVDKYFLQYAENRLDFSVVKKFYLRFLNQEAFHQLLKKKINILRSMLQIAIDTLDDT